MHSNFYKERKSPPRGQFKPTDTGHGLHPPRNLLPPPGGAYGKAKRNNCEADPDGWVPGLVIRRSIEGTDDFNEFLDALEERVSRNYRVSHVGSAAMSIVAEKDFIASFVRDPIGPDPEEVEEVAEVIVEDLGDHLKSVPRVVPTIRGELGVVGEERKKIAFLPFGGRGILRKQARRDYTTGEYSLGGLVSRERAIALGRLTEWFIDDHSEANFSRIAGSTPHFTIAKKIKGGSISQSELNTIAGLLRDVMPQTLSFFDPHVTTHTESGQYRRFYPRNPKIRDYGQRVPGIPHTLTDLRYVKYTGVDVRGY